MTVNVLFFGRLAEIAGTAVTLDNVTDTEGLTRALHDQYPELANLAYRLAIDQKMIVSNTPVTERSVIALLPPFSGG